jgi:hypothetical protein
LRFALGKYHDDTGDYELAFANYQRANEIAREHGHAYDPVAFDRGIDALIHSHGVKSLPELHAGAGSSERPIIVFCVHFQANENAVRTFSRWQVRQKIVKTSVDHWRRYEKFAGPLRHLVDHPP